MKLQNVNPRYLTDYDGKKISVVLPIREFEELLEDIHDLAVIAERREEKTISHNELINGLKKDGLI
jgi:hypothetical protein